MAYKCLDCGEIFDEPATSYDSVPYGESYATIDCYVCPCCGGDFEEASVCQDCGEPFEQEDLYSGYCLDCIKENWDKPQDLFDFAASITKKGEINEFALDMFGGVDGVNAVLKLLLNSIFYCNPQMLKSKKEQFIEDYAYCLAERWEEQHNEQP